MKHYLLLKMKSGYMTPELFALTQKTFHDLAEQTDFILSAEVHQNCIERDSNADLLIMMDIRDSTALDAYLKHPIHQAYVQATKDHLEWRKTFDRI